MSVLLCVNGGGSMLIIYSLDFLRLSHHMCQGMKKNKERNSETHITHRSVCRAVDGNRVLARSSRGPIVVSVHSTFSHMYTRKPAIPETHKQAGM